MAEQKYIDPEIRGTKNVMLMLPIVLAVRNRLLLVVQQNGVMIKYCLLQFYFVKFFYFKLLILSLIKCYNLLVLWIDLYFKFFDICVPKCNMLGRSVLT
jgi:hypothetical protein